MVRHANQSGDPYIGHPSFASTGIRPFDSTHVGCFHFYAILGTNKDPRLQHRGYNRSAGNNKIRRETNDKSTLVLRIASQKVQLSLRETLSLMFLHTKIHPPPPTHPPTHPSAHNERKLNRAGFSTSTAGRTLTNNAQARCHVVADLSCCSLFAIREFRPKACYLYSLWDCSQRLLTCCSATCLLCPSPLGGTKHEAAKLSVLEPRSSYLPQRQ